MQSKRFRFQAFVRRLLSPFLKWLYIKYTSKERHFSYNNIEIDIYPGVFPPRFFHTTHFILEYLTKQDVAGKTLLELGAGSGLISLFAALQNAKVTATDISESAVNNIKANAKKNNLSISVTKSDLFTKIRKKKFDWIIINPPFYTKEPKNDPERAWYCGENYEYFSSLFENISGYMQEECHVIMVLTDTAPIKQIIYLAGISNLVMRVETIKKHLLERCFIFTINKVQ